MLNERYGSRERGRPLADHQQQQPKDWGDDDGDSSDLPVYKRENNMNETVVCNGL